MSYDLAISDSQLLQLRLKYYKNQGGMFYIAMMMPDCGIFTNGTSYKIKTDGSGIKVPDIVCPYNINDIFEVKEGVAKTSSGWAYNGVSFSVDGVIVETEWKYQDKDKKWQHVYKTNGGKDYDLPNGVTNSDLFHTGASVTPGDVVKCPSSSNIVCASFYSGTREITRERIQRGIRIDVDAGRGIVDNPITQFTVPSTVDRVYLTTYVPEMIYSVGRSPREREPEVKNNFSKIKIYPSENYSPDLSYLAPENCPSNAVRMYGRIVSIKLWSLNQQIYDEYLVDAFDPAAVGKVIKNYDSGVDFLRKIRKPRNKEALGKSFQRIATSVLPYSNQWIPFYTTDRNVVTYNGTSFGYNTGVVDPTYRLFVWMIGCYLCDKDGNVIDDYF